MIGMLQECVTIPHNTVHDDDGDGETTVASRREYIQRLLRSPRLSQVIGDRIQVTGYRDGLKQGGKDELGQEM